MCSLEVGAGSKGGGKGIRPDSHSPSQLLERTVTLTQASVAISRIPNAELGRYAVSSTNGEPASRRETERVNDSIWMMNQFWQGDIQGVPGQLNITPGSQAFFFFFSRFGLILCGSIYRQGRFGYMLTRGIPERKTGRRKRQTRDETRKNLRWKEERVCVLSWAK